MLFRTVQTTVRLLDMLEKLKNCVIRYYRQTERTLVKMLVERIQF